MPKDATTELAEAWIEREICKCYPADSPEADYVRRVAAMLPRETIEECAVLERRRQRDERTNTKHA